MRIYLEVSLDAYWPSLSQGLQQQIQREINALLNDDKRIAIKTVPPTNGLHSEQAERGPRAWGKEGDASTLANLYRTFSITMKPPRGGAIARVVLELQKSGRKTFRVPELLEIVERLAPERDSHTVLNQLWANRYLNNEGLTLPEDSTLKERVL